MKIIKTLVTSGLALGMLLSASNAKEYHLKYRTYSQYLFSICSLI